MKRRTDKYIYTQESENVRLNVWDEIMKIF